jgi:hypothetical protein
VRWIALHVLGLKRDSLTDVQWRRCEQRIGDLASGERRVQLLGFVPGIAALALIPLWIRLGSRTSLPWRVAFELTFGLCGAAYVYWLMGWRYRRHGFRALRELGLADVCARCGYDLSRQPQPEGRCPECGEPFSQFHPDRTWSTGPP